MAAGRGGGFSTKAGRGLFARCMSIAMERYAQCRAGKPVGPFPIWDIRK